MSSSVGTRVRPSSNGHRPAGPSVVRAGQPVPTKERHTPYIALMLVLVVGTGLLFAFFYNRAGAKVPVVEVARAVPAGHTISRTDLTTVSAAGGITAISGADLESLVGQTAKVALVPKTVLNRAMLMSGPSLSAGQARVGVQVKPGQTPAGGVSPGDQVEVLQLPPKDGAGSGAGDGGSAATSAVLVKSAAVYEAVADPSQSGGALVTVVVPASVAASVAAASNAGLVALVEVAS